MFKYDLSELAEADFATARRWYDRQDTKLGDRFIDDVVVTFERLCKSPEAYVEVEPGIRAVNCRQFPYRVYYAIAGELIEILAIYHTARDPDRWDDVNR